MLFPDISTRPSYAPWPADHEFEVRTDGKTGIRHYRHRQGPWLVSSTTALGIIAKGYAFDNWIAGQERDRYDLELAKAVLEPIAPEYLLATVKARVGGAYAYVGVRDTAADDGKAVHEAVRAFLEAEVGKGAPPIPHLTPEQLVSFSTFVSWWIESKLEAVAMEQRLTEPDWGYGGATDLIARRDGVLGIVDLKRTKWISNSYHYQVSSYMRAARRHGDIGWGCIVKLPKGGRPLEIQELGKGMFGGDRTEAECMHAFKCALELWRCENPRGPK